MATSGYLWLLVASFGYFWLLFDTFGYFWLFLATLGHYWLLLTNFGYIWLLLVTYGYFWPDFYNVVICKLRMLRLNQAKISDNVIRKSDMGESKWQVSRCQCKIIINLFFFVMLRKSSSVIYVSTQTIPQP